ncbi:MAG: NADH-quinone oxidoreductase subunit M [Armatimonadetes bacterium]|nr:NADH-quinone oxidoreductase subunit M [Armatimonadota bacterium]
MEIGILTQVVFLPLVGALILLMIPNEFSKAIKIIGLLVALATFALSLVVIGRFQSGTYHFQMMESIPWIPQFGITYKLGVDGISVWLIVLSALLMVISAWFSMYVKNRVKLYFVCLMVLETAMLGVFTSLDLILFYTFFEAALIPMALLIAAWGGSNRQYAAIKFFLYTFSASIFMLVGIIVMAGLYKKATGSISFDLIAIQSAVANGSLWQGALQLQALIFWSFAIAFMVKCPMFPFHTWLPDAHTEAPTAGSIILAGVLLKMGTYGFLRFCLPLFPDVVAAQAPILMWLAVAGIIYGAVVAAMQTDLKRLVAYSSVAHMGFVTLGIFSLTHTGMMGGSYQQLSHGISTGALFLLVGLLYERIHTRMFKDMGGLKTRMPIFAALFLLIMLSSVGLPGLNGFVGEFLALLGAFEAGMSGVFGYGIVLPIIAATGVVLAAVYLLWMFQKVFYGRVTNPVVQRLKDLKKWEIAMVGVLVFFAFWGGLYPGTFLKPMEKSIAATRHMALNPVGERPNWEDTSLEIDESGNFVKVAPRSSKVSLEDYAVIRVIAPAGNHFDLPDGFEVANLSDEEAIR